MLRVIDTSELMRKKVILVDHNDPAQSVEGLDEAEIVEVVDHHNIGNISTHNPINFRNMSVGSVNTIIYTLFNEYKVKIPREIAGLMLSGIVSDTLLFASPTTTDLDRETARSLAKSFGLEVMDFTELKRRICQYDHIFNTVPKQILKEDILRKISKESCIIDIASYPGGTNHQMAEKLGICAKLCPSLPGIYSPKSSGIMLAKKVLEISGEIKHGIEK